MLTLSVHQVTTGAKHDVSVPGGCTVSYAYKMCTEYTASDAAPCISGTACHLLQ
jgi:hypothetical protein